MPHNGRMVAFFRNSVGARITRPLPGFVHNFGSAHLSKQRKNARSGGQAGRKKRMKMDFKLEGRQLIWDYLLLTVGALLTAFAFAAFFVANDIAPTVSSR